MIKKLKLPWNVPISVVAFSHLGSDRVKARRVCESLRMGRPLGQSTIGEISDTTHPYAIFGGFAPLMERYADRRAHRRELEFAREKQRARERAADEEWEKNRPKPGGDVWNEFLRKRGEL